MKLQDILFPDNNICNETQLYFHTRGKCEVKSSEVRMDKGSTIIADTYFNSFSLEKWMKYTKITDLQLCFNVRGFFKVRIFQMYRKNTKLVMKTLQESSFDVNGCVQLVIDSLPLKGILGFELKAKSKDCVLHGGCYETSSSEVFPCKIAIDMCTFKREEYITHNLDILNQYIINNTASPLYKKLHVYISDNGQTLDIDTLSTSYIHIHKNKNVGGVGGFTRNMLEILDDNKKGGGFTHILIMDDDAVINPHAIEKTYAFLCLRKEEHKDISLGGAIFLLDSPYIQFECGARWRRLCLQTIHGPVDMRNPIAVAYCEEETDAQKIDGGIRKTGELEREIDYFGWWFCCMPVTSIQEDNLPLPIFIHWDDIEFGIRAMKECVTINGICVWHENFEDKMSGTMEYYNERNEMMCAAIHYPEIPVKQYIDRIRVIATRCMMIQRNHYVLLRLRGIEDFLKGIDWFMNLDAEAYHKEICKMNKVMHPVEAFGITREYADLKTPLKAWKHREVEFISPRYIHWRNKIRNIKAFWKKCIFTLTYNGMLLPPKNNAVIIEPTTHIAKVFRAGRVIHYDLNGNAYSTQRNLKEVFEVYKECHRIIKLLKKNYARVAAEYRTRYKEMTNRQYWEKYLENK